MRKITRRTTTTDADLDITSFMNLMIILVPVLLMTMVFAQTTVIELKLPPLSDSQTNQELPVQQLEVVLRSDHIDINYPSGLLLKRIPHREDPLASATQEGEPEFIADFEQVQQVLQEVKRRLRERGDTRRDLLLLSEPDTSYQTLVSAMDAVRSYKAVLITDVVDAELFPEITLGDAPASDNPSGALASLN